MNYAQNAQCGVKEYLSVNVSLFQIGSRSSVYSPESSVRKTGSYIYEEFMPTDGTDVKVLNNLASSLARDCITLFLLIY